MEEKTTSNYINLFTHPRSVIVLSVILLLPLLFMGTHTSHDWGDDFAQYIHQAKNIVNGIPQSETGYIYNTLSAVIGPHAYPMGFPLLLAPIYSITGNNMLAFTTYISVIYIILGLLMVSFYRKNFSAIISLLLTFIFLYNPQMILFKGEVMSDIPFTALLLLNLILYQKLKSGNLIQMILLSVFIGFMLAVRPAGITFVAAIIMEQLVLLYKRKTKIRDFVIHTGIFTIIPILVYLTINLLVFQIPSGGSTYDYQIFFSSINLIRIIPENVVHHIKVLRYFLVPETGNFKGFSYFFGAIMMIMILLGFIKRIRKNPEVMDWLFIFYFIMLIIYPKNASAFRLMIPLGFIFLFYAATGIQTIKMVAEISAWKKAVAIGLLFFVLYMPGIIGVVVAGNKILDGPQIPSSVEAFDFINKNVPPTAIVVFAKPRALALYSGCQSMADPLTDDPAQINYQIMEARASYLLIHSKLTKEPMKQYLRLKQNRITRQWENKDFVLYKLNFVSP